MSILFFAAKEDLYSTQDVVLYALLGISVVITILALLFGMITLLSKAVGKAENKAAALPPLPAVEAEERAQSAALPTAALPESESQGKLELVETDEETAAILMAIISDRSGIPLNHLAFKRIRLIRE
ncbi:MAG: OadG family protein [Oscillospiraceae bacterium]|jgi:Na+-transporting methylmalonyl-CoA/oxaloacetate decarboxylase gamma subunit|nr:OadG family protein [Oscillospiraceae bacterium]